MSRLIPVNMMMERVARHGQESDAIRFWELTYAGEFLAKWTAATLVAAVDDSRDRDRYTLEHKLVRADGIGEWVQAMEQAVSGPPANHLNVSARDVRNELTIRDTAEGWRHAAVAELEEVLRKAYDPSLNVKEQPSLRLWFNLFVQLRNKARGHGAPSPGRLSACVEDLESSIARVVSDLPVQRLDFAYLHRNLSGKYRVVSLTEGDTPFEKLKTSDALKIDNLVSGIYVWLNGPRRINLIYADQDCADFFSKRGF